jgi:hypothetical protein
VVETVAVIAAAAAVGVAVAGARAADAHRVARERAICLPRNMPRPRAANPADMRIAAVRRAVLTIGVRKLRVLLRLPRPMPPRTRSSFPVNHWQSIATSQRLHPLLLLVLSMKCAKSAPASRKLHRAPPATCPQRLRAAATFLAGSLAGCPAGSWPMRERKQRLRKRLRALWKKFPRPAAALSNPYKKRPETAWKPYGMTPN